MGKLICYKMTHDTAFAPNPFFGVLTLATCKPGIRRNRNIGAGDWISGWTSRCLDGSEPGQERLVYIAKIDEKISMEDYWERFPEKRVTPEAIDNELDVRRYGDNIYEPIEGGGFRQHKNSGDHGDGDYKRDTGGENVLICREFYYFPVVNNGKKPEDNHSLDMTDHRGRLRMHRNFTYFPEEERIETLIGYAKDQFERGLKESGLSKEDYILKLRNLPTSNK